MNLMNEAAGGTNLQLTEAASNVTRIAMEHERSQTTLDQAPDAAARSEVQLRKIIDTIPTLVWRSLPDGRLDYLNQRWLDYTGLSLEQAHDCGWKATVDPDDVDRVTSQWLPEVLTSGQPGAIEVRLRRFDGEYRWFLMCIAPFRDETGSAVHWYGTNTDIEDRKRAEEKVREDGLRDQLTINSISQMVVVLAPDGSALYANQPVLDYIIQALPLRKFRRRMLERVSFIQKTSRPSGKNASRPWRAKLLFTWNCGFLERMAGIVGFFSSTTPCLMSWATWSGGTPTEPTSTTAKRLRSAFAEKTSRSARKLIGLPCSEKSWVLLKHFDGCWPT